MINDLLAALAFAVAAVLLLEGPRRAFVKAGGAQGLDAYDAWLGAALFAVGFLVFKTGIGGYFADQLALSLACEIFAATVYANLRFAIVPDLYCGLLLIVALGHAFNTGAWLQAALGALACGVAGMTLFLGAGFLRAVRGIGLDEAKLAVGVGALLGWAWGLGALAASLALATVAAGLLLVARRSQQSEEGPKAVPLGAVLALASGFALWWSLM